LLGYISMQHEVGEQGLQTKGVETGHSTIGVGQAEIAEQPRPKDWHWHDRLPLFSSALSYFRKGKSLVPKLH
jgi:hypothetical protein